MRTADVMARPEMHRQSPPPEPVRDFPSAELREVVEQQPMSWEQRLEEHYFHDVVNGDAEMYSEIEAIPADDKSVADQMLAVITNHGSEVWSPPG